MKNENLPKNPETGKQKTFIQSLRLKIGHVLAKYTIPDNISETLRQDLPSQIIRSLLLSIIMLYGPDKSDLIKTIGPYVVLGLGDVASSYFSRATLQKMIYENIAIFASSLAPLPQMLREKEGKYVVKERIENECKESLREVAEHGNRIESLSKRFSYLNKTNSIINKLQLFYALYLIAAKVMKYREAVKTLF
ncbi:MAG: hypothetical protein PHU71_03510 [Candidatus Gracilibacteria bacterium]|nr:hypothetical protein [Candidatus Gracilibacteria bacterium]